MHKGAFIKIIKSAYESNIEGFYGSDFHRQIGIVLRASGRPNT